MIDEQIPKPLWDAISRYTNEAASGMPLHEQLESRKDAIRVEFLASLSRERERADRAEAALREVRTLAYEWQTCDAIEGENGEVTRGLAVAKALCHCADGVLHVTRAALAGSEGGDAT